MDTPESDRLLRLEARVAALEARLRAAGGTVPVEPRATPFAPWPVVEPPRTVPPPLPPRSPDAPAAGQAPAKATSDLERFVGLAVLGRIGVAAVVIAAAYFGQLGWNQIGPGARVFCIYVGAAAMLAAGFALRARVAPRYTALLFGGAVALTYVAGALAKLRYDLIGADLALALLVGSAALGQVLGRLLRLEAMATVALAGGYAAPVLVGEPSSSPTVFFVYLLGLHTWAAWTQHRWAWSWARRLAVVATALLGTAWFLTNPLPSATSVALHAEGLLLGLAAPELLAAFARRHVPDGRWLAIVLGAWAVQVVLLAWTMAHGTVAPLGLVAGAVLLGLGMALRQRGAEVPGQAIDLSRLGGTVLAVGALAFWNVPAAPFANNLDQPWPRLATLLGASAVLLAVRRWSGACDLALAVAALLGLDLVLWQVPGDDRRRLAAAALLLPFAMVILCRHRPAAAFGLTIGGVLAFLAPLDGLRFLGEAGAWLAAACAATGAWCMFGVFAGAHRCNPMLRTAAAALLAALGIAWVAIAALRWPGLLPPEGGVPFEVLPFVVNLRFLAALAILAAVVAAIVTCRRRPLEHASRVDLVLFGITALAIAYLAGLAEMLGLVHDWPYGWSAVTISLYTLLFSAALLVAGFVSKNPLLRWPGLCGFFVVVAKVAVWDLREVDTPLRMLVSGALGLVLLLGAYAYARARKHASPS